MWNAGQDAWSRAVWTVERTIAGVDVTRDELLPYVGPAAALPLFGLLAHAPHAVAVRIWSGLLALALGGIALASLALARTQRIGALLGAFALTLASGPATSALALGQSAMLSAAGIALALLAFERRWIAAGAGATLLAGIQPNLVPVLIARMRDRAALLSAVIGGAAFVALTLAAGGGLPGLRAYQQRLAEHGLAERFVTIQHTPAAIAWSFGASANVASAIGALIALAALVAIPLAIVRARLGARDGTLLALCALPLALPFFHEHDFVVVLIPLCVLAVVARGPARALAGIAAACVLVDWLGLAQRPPAVAQIVTLAFAVACGFVLLGSGARTGRSDVAPFVAAAALACVAIPLALAHPAPTWPDALPPGYHAPANADISAVWAGEQHAAGLDARVPAWGVLRAIPLAGCIILGIAVVLTGRRRLPPA